MEERRDGFKALADATDRNTAVMENILMVMQADQPTIRRRQVYTLLLLSAVIVVGLLNLAALAFVWNIAEDTRANGEELEQVAALNRASNKQIRECTVASPAADPNIEPLKDENGKVIEDDLVHECYDDGQKRADVYVERIGAVVAQAIRESQ